MDKTKYLQNLKNEITNDPSGLGYAGKTPQHIADMINNPVEIVTDILYEPIVESKPGAIVGQKKEIKDPRVFQIIGGIAGAPNGVTAQDVTEAMK